MKVLHISKSSGGYEVVTLLASRISRTNHLALIERNGVQYMTGGFLINNTPKIREVLDSLPVHEQFKFISDFKMTPFTGLSTAEENGLI